MLLKLEKELAMQRGRIGENTSEDECIQVMQRKVNLGMNAILSISLAMARMIAHVQGKDLWQLLRAEMKQAVAKLLIEHAGIEMMSSVWGGEKIHELKKNTDISWQTLCDRVSFDELILALQQVNNEFSKKGIKLHKVLRKQLDVYSDKR